MNKIPYCTHVVFNRFAQVNNLLNNKVIFEIKQPRRKAYYGVLNKIQ